MLETSFIINRKANKILLYIKIIFINLSFIKLIKLYIQNNRLY